MSVAANAQLGSGSTAPVHKKSNWFAKFTKKPAANAPRSANFEPQASQMAGSAARGTAETYTEEEEEENANVTVEAQTPTETVVDSCRCCGTLITYPSKATKIKCSVCQIVFLLGDTNAARSDRPEANVDLSYSALKRLLEEKCHDHDNGTRFEALEEYLTACFGSFEVLNHSFRRPKAHYDSCLNYHEINKFYKLVLRLPTLRPYQKLLSAANQAVSRPAKFGQPDETFWLLILLELPSLPASLVPSSKAFNREVNTLSYEILKKIIGLLGYADMRTNKFLVQCFARLDRENFMAKVDLVNLYITYTLNKCLKSESKRSKTAGAQRIAPHLSSTNQDSRETEQEGKDPQRPHSRFWMLGPSSHNSFAAIPNHLKIKLTQYGNDWHLRTAGRFSSMLFTSSQTYRSDNAPVSIFYNTMADYVNVRQDFDAWQYTNNSISRRSSSTGATGNEPSLESVVDYLQTATTTGIYGIGNSMSPMATKMKPSFTFCHYPFLLSLGAKISILEYEAKRQMERKAEEAFISSINKKVPIDVYLKLRVRRDHISHDSLRGILQHQSDLKKSLRVEFVNEPGIDAGGLKKEWFLLLTKDLFSPQSGLFSYNSESNLAWFSFSTIENHEMYFLVGVILGLAIYNSTILDLQFPKFFYKKLLGRNKANLDDFIELYPTSGANLKKLMSFDKNFDFASLELYYEATFKDIFGNKHTKELILNGSRKPVTYENRIEYVHRYVNFYMNDLVFDSMKSFLTGFNNVIGGNSLSLFNAEEIQMLLIGDDTGTGTNEGKFIDVSTLKVITKYQGGLTPDCELSTWFWEFIDSLDSLKQKKLLMFISGSDRLPPTGLQALNFKMTLLRGSEERLPIAHTCFNELCLYNYTSRAQFVRKLMTAIHESEGFGIK